MPDHCRQRPRSCRSVRLARTRTANLVVHRPIHRFVPTPTTVLRAKAIASTAPARPPSDQRRGQFPIAPAAPSVPYPPQFRALALFGRRPPERVVGIVGAGIRKPAHKETSSTSRAWANGVGSSQSRERDVPKVPPFQGSVGADGRRIVQELQHLDFRLGAVGAPNHSYVNLRE